VQPQVEFGFDGVYAQYYTPPQLTASEYPFLSVNDQVAHFSYNIFNGYKEFAALNLRTALAKALDMLHPDRLVKTSDLPKFVRVYLTCQPSGREVLHLTAHIPEKRTDNCEVIEDDLTVLPSVIYVKTDKTAAFSEPGHTALTVERQGEYLKISVPLFTGYSIITLE
jgi:hypothetical protein